MLMLSRTSGVLVFVLTEASSRNEGMLALHALLQQSALYTMAENNAHKQDC